MESWGTPVEEEEEVEGLLSASLCKGWRSHRLFLKPISSLCLSLSLGAIVALSDL